MNASPPNNAALLPVILAGAGPGDPDLLTVKAHRAIAAADVILHDALVDPRILALATGRLINVGKRCGRHAMKQSEICALLVRHARTGARVLRLKGGDPMIFGRANEEIAALRAAGIGLTIIPGITAATAAAAAVEASLTARDIARSVTFITGHASDGGLPEQDWAALARLRGTIAFYMGARHAGMIADRLIEAGLDPATPGIIVMNISRADETHRTARLIDLADGIAADELASPALILIGAALDVARQPARSLTCRVKLTA
ncbi:MAG: uroporphyrinogen-III C-methyltransferase [Acidiphilium sp. 37-64-53]|uniref:uroporphyrinogen-III C-methyltransferase n=1 Tax=Acidiphilium TaxID=522 RepID=UPI000BC7C59F|nr:MULTISPECIES: uroporphyrinogen-III C-methyltransferase [Acidiphilium]OYW02997.1 MAG: uroporphyrinogen-III C-methyltransferase [Acidiphilium sp. 37-64-53]OZB29371.1 MAG: uroporphyrinogen-III C-methyltransferase [Acidiphilium sp. 34-64-41]HQT84319.1 uroporphyrinogen-III C-methyltransferase [Acidiphilium rubrum]